MPCRDKGSTPGIRAFSHEWILNPAVDNHVEKSGAAAGFFSVRGASNGARGEGQRWALFD